MFLVLLKMYLPMTIRGFIFSICRLNVSFGILGLNTTLKDFWIEHSDGVLSELGVVSISSFFNLFDHLFLLLLAVITHLIFLLLKLKCRKSKSTHCFVKLVNWIAQKTWNLLNFAFYIRTFMLFSHFWIVCSIFEIYKANLSSISTQISLVFSIIILCVIIAFSSLNIVLAFNNSDLSPPSLNELFANLKNTKMARMYNVALMIRRVVLVSIMICLSNADKFVLLFISVLCQVIHVVMIIKVRPYTSLKDNLIEVQVNVIFIILLLILILLNTQDSWNDVATSIYLSLMCFPLVFIFFISIGKFYY